MSKLDELYSKRNGVVQALKCYEHIPNSEDNVAIAKEELEQANTELRYARVDLRFEGFINEKDQTERDKAKRIALLVEAGVSMFWKFMDDACGFDVVEQLWGDRDEEVDELREDVALEVMQKIGVLFSVVDAEEVDEDKDLFFCNDCDYSKAAVFNMFSRTVREMEKTKTGRE